ncbi:hypothetical protein L7F22_012440 [Adiantum nelumboides]|nr:hypothetical protein [Adiantum nelumboides]
MKTGLVPDCVGTDPNTMDESTDLCRAWGKVKDQEALIFFDGGAKANFISPELAARLESTLYRMGPPAEAVLAAPSRDVAITPVIGKLRLHCQGYLGHEDFYIMPLEGCDVLLGIPWYHKNSAVVDYRARKATLTTEKGRSIVLDIKLKGESVPIVSASAISKLMKTSLFVYSIFLKEVWQLHVAEQALLDDEEYRAAGIVNPPQKLNEIPTAERFYVDPDSFWTEEELCDKKFLSLVLTQHEWELDMDSARKEREAVNKAREEAEKKGEEFEKPKPQRIKYIEELDIMNWQRYLEEHEAVQRDRVNRLEFGLPLEEPGKYADDSFFGENKYNPREKRWRKDYLGDYSKFKDDGKQQRTSQPRLNGNKSNEDGKSVNLQGKEVGGSGWTKDKDFVTNSFKENGEEKGNGEKLVNGTESSTVSNMNGLSRLTDEDNLGGETE